MTAVLFLVFLGRLLRSTTGKVFLIVDRLRAHKAPEVLAWVAAHGDRIELFYLPTYAPELNATGTRSWGVRGSRSVFLLTGRLPTLYTTLDVVLIFQAVPVIFYTGLATCGSVGVFVLTPGVVAAVERDLVSVHR